MADADIAALLFILLFLFVVAVPEREGEQAHDQDAELQESRPAVALVPVGVPERESHNTRADHRADPVKAVQEVHHAGWIMHCDIMVQCGVDRAGAEPVGNGEDKQHPVGRGKRKAHQPGNRQENRENDNPLCRYLPDQLRADQGRYNRHTADCHGYVSGIGRRDGKCRLHARPS